MKYTLKSPISSRAEALRIGRMAETWCRKNMGVNSRKKYDVVVTFYKSMEGDEDMGEYRYWDNEIIVYYNNTPSIKEFIKTIIHEWQHQLQTMSKYDESLARTGYRNNPYEKEAIRAENEHYSTLWTSIKHKLNK